MITNISNLTIITIYNSLLVLDGTATIGNAPWAGPSVHVHPTASDTTSIATYATPVAPFRTTRTALPIPISVPIPMVCLLLGVLAWQLEGMLSIVVPVPVLIPSGTGGTTAATQTTACTTAAGGALFVATL